MIFNHGFLAIVATQPFGELFLTIAPKLVLLNIRYSSINMKIIINKHERNFNVRRILFLRYGTEEPALDAKPIIAVGFVADLLRMPHEKVKWMIRQYFAIKKMAVNRESIQPPKLNPSKLH